MHLYMGDFRYPKHKRLNFMQVQTCFVVTRAEHTGHVVTRAEHTVTGHVVTRAEHTGHVVTRTEHTEHTVTRAEHTVTGHVVTRAGHTGHVVTRAEHTGHVVKAIFHYSRFARAGGATNFHHVKNQSRRHAKKVECSSTLTRVREQASGQKLRRPDNYGESWIMFAPPARSKRLHWKMALTRAEHTGRQGAPSSNLLTTNNLLKYWLLSDSSLWIKEEMFLFSFSLSRISSGNIYYWITHLICPCLHEFVNVCSRFLQEKIFVCSLCGYIHVSCLIILSWIYKIHLFGVFFRSLYTKPSEFIAIILHLWDIVSPPYLRVGKQGYGSRSKDVGSSPGHNLPHSVHSRDLWFQRCQTCTSSDNARQLGRN